MNTSFYSLISYFLFGGEIPKISDWENVYMLFSKHAILPLAGTKNRLDDFDNIPENILTEWKKAVQDGMSVFFYVRYAGKKLTELLEENEIVPVILKGAATGKYYPEPAFRTYGDIDFVVYGEKDVESVAKILMSNGFLCESNTDELINLRHIKFKKNGIEYEFHQHFSLRIDENDYLLDEMLKRAIPEKQDDFYCYDDVLNGIILLMHLKNHMLFSSAGIRQVIDFLCFADKVLTEDFWNEKFHPVLDRLSLTKFAVHTVRMCEIFFGLKPHSFSASADDELCRQFMNEILLLGNFGRSQDRFKLSVLRFVDNKGTFLRQLQGGGKVRWEAAQKHKFLVPFAWIYQTFRILGILISSRKRGKRISDVINHKKETELLLYNLDIRKNQDDK